MYNKLMVPMDGSKLAECVLDHVRDIATGCNVPEVVLFNVATSVLPDWYADVTPSADLSIHTDVVYQKWIKGYLGKIEERLKQDNIVAKSVLVKGKAAESIMDYAQKNGVDLIVMSTHGRSGPSRWLMGSVADRVVRRSSVPVLIVTPPGCREAKRA